MNPMEKMCDLYREELSCAHTHKLNVTTQMGRYPIGHYFGGYAGFFRRKRDVDSSKNKPMKCFLDIGRYSLFQLMSLNFGPNKRWTESNFVLIDDGFAPFQPPRTFQSLPSINFAWLLKHTFNPYLGQTITSTGIFVFAADSDVHLFYHDAEMSGL